MRGIIMMYDDKFNIKDMEDMQKLLRANNKTITCAESCTGGLIASLITEVSGSSDIFRGSIVTYCNDIKEQELNVSKNTMIEHGVVSNQVVEEMCLGVRKKFNSNYSISVSGIAGPGGGAENKPVGMICFAIFEENSKIISDTIYLKGSRKSIQLGASKIILKKIYIFLQKRLDI